MNKGGRRPDADASRVEREFIPRPQTEQQKRLERLTGEMGDERARRLDGNFTSDGDLLLPCSERDVDVREYRRVFEQCLRYRAGLRA